MKSILLLNVSVLSACIFCVPLAGGADIVNGKRHIAVAFDKNRLYRPQCSDKKDNDRDGFRDYPRDRGCRSRRDNSEWPRSRRPRPLPAPTATPAVPTISPLPIPELGVGAALNGARPFPDDNIWNKDISAEEVDPNSGALITSIGFETGLHPDFGTVWEGAPIGIPYVIVDGNQAGSTVTFQYHDESDPGPYPIPENPPVEGGVQSSGDRHVIIVDRSRWKLYELYNFNLTSGGATAGSGAIFDLNSNALRPAGWTSADAAGLPIFPGLVRYDEVMQQKEIRHALRFTAQRTRRAYVFPARHYASSYSSESLPPMGMRVRLKASFDTSTFPEPVQVILKALKKYGMFLADNGSNWYISGAPDSRWDDEALSAMRNVRGKHFEVVKMGQMTSG